MKRFGMGLGVLGMKRSGLCSKIGMWAALAACFCVPSVAGATQTTGLDLVKSSSCLACHRVDGRRVGPAFTLIAQRFAGQPGAADYLAHTIRSGGRGRWGPIPMPAQPQVTPEQASAIAAWILSLAKDSHGQAGK
jgi:cytochrome c